MSAVPISNTVKEYIQLETHINQLETQLKELKKRQEPLEERIQQYIQANKLENKDIKWGDYKIRYEQKQTKEGLTQGYLDSMLRQYFKELYGGKYSDDLIHTKAKEVYDYILNHRATRISSQLKMIKNNS